MARGARDFRRLTVWSKAHELVLAIYKLTQAFPRTETYGLVSQMRRAAVSIPCNIAEGCGRTSETDMARFLDVAHGSASELAYQVLLSRDLSYLQTEEFAELEAAVDAIGRMLTAYAAKLRNDHA